MDTRERLLRAAAEVIRRDGPQAPTLEAVAAQAGVSKGGLLYHFPSKQALLDALIAWWIEEFESDVDGRSDGTPDGWVRAYLSACDVDAMTEEERAVQLGLVTAMASEPDKMADVRARNRAWHERALAAPDPEAAMIVLLASDGMWLADMFGWSPPRELRDRVVARLEALVGSRPDDGS